MNIFVIAVISIALSVTAQFSLKAGMSAPAVKAVLGQPFTLQTVYAVMTNVYVMGGFLLYGLGAIVWLSVLAKWDVSKAYPLVGLGFIFTLIAGALLGEQVTTTRVIGVALISSGVYFVART